MITLRLSAAPVAFLAVAAVAQAPASDTGFRRDPALMRAKQDQLVAAIRAKDPATATQLERAFQQDVAEVMRPAFRPFGFTPDDAADMTAAYWVTAWEASHGKAGVQTDPAIARGVRKQIAGLLGPQLRGKSDADKQDIADAMLLQTLFADARMTAAKQAGPEPLRAMSDTIHREASQLLKVDLRRVEMTAAGMRPVGGTTPDSNTAPSAAAAPTPGSGKTAAVSGLYFRATYGLNAALSFEPLVFFADGAYVELDETPLSDLDAAADRARAPARWGTWRKQGETFLLTSNKGRTSDYRLGTGSFFPAFPSEKGPRLSGTYKATSGTTMYLADGPVSTLGVNSLTFNAEGSFVEGSSGGGVAPGVSAYSRGQKGGRWQLGNSALELVYSDGRRVRKSFVWGASGTPPRPDIDMAFIGGRAYLRDD